MLQNNLNRKAQVSETLTWIVATIVILVFSVIFVYSVSLLSTSEKITNLGEIEMVFSRLTQAEDSGKASQEMLFAILSKDNGKIKNLILNNDNNKAEIEAGKILNEFSKQGVNCEFYVYNEGEYFNQIDIGDAGDEKTAEINIDERIAGLKC